MISRTIFSHNEKAGWFYPRHPVVCIIDSVGFLIAFSLILFYQPHFTTLVLPTAVMLQYTVSFIHHWFSYSELRSKVDRGMIFILIAATYVPYWEGLLPAHESLERLVPVGISALIGLILLFSNVSEKIIGIYWALFASAGLVVSFFELQAWLPKAALLFFWIGTLFYGVQQVIYTFEYPDPLPNVFGYREVQHIVLLIATTIGSLVALQYT